MYRASPACQLATLQAVIDAVTAVREAMGEGLERKAQEVMKWQGVEAQASLYGVNGDEVRGGEGRGGEGQEGLCMGGVFIFHTLGSGHLHRAADTAERLPLPVLRLST